MGTVKCEGLSRHDSEALNRTPNELNYKIAITVGLAIARSTIKYMPWRCHV